MSKLLWDNRPWSLRLALRYVAFMLVMLLFASVQAANPTTLWNEIRNLAGDDAVSQTAWGVVETNCDKFIKKYPESEFLPNVLAVQAQALFNEKKWDAVISKFSNPPTNAVKVADQLAYWTARSYFEKGNFGGAAENFAKLGREHPASLLRIEAIYRECEAYAKLGQWQRVIEELQEANGAFQGLARTNANDQWVVSGKLLLAGAELARKNIESAKAAKKTIGEIAPQTRPELEWHRQFLLCRANLDTGLAKDALAATTNLLSADMGNMDWRARGLFLKGEIYENMRRFGEAARTYESILGGDMPAERRQEALVRIVELTLRKDVKPDVEAAAQKLTDYLAKYPGENGSDFEWLMLGELNLRRELLSQTQPAGGQGTNFLQQAEDNFTKLIRDFTNSPYLGKAELDLGWSYAKEGKIPESLGIFSNAVAHLPFSEDQAVARFKLADTLFMQGDFASAMTNYSAIIERYGVLPGVKNDLFEQTLYQLVRACLKQTNTAASMMATNAVNKILTWFPDGILADRSMLLYGQSLTPAAARGVFLDLEKKYPDSALLPEMKLALARTYEKESKWSDALQQYDVWVRAYPSNIALPRAEFWRAWATYQSGNETNALQLFTNFIARFGSNEVAQAHDLPARAQFWIGDYYWRQTDFQRAETSYEEVFLKWTNSPLAYRAKWMAGCAAYQGQRPDKATNYFSSLSPDTNCPADLRSQAAFAFGDAAMQLSSTNDTNRYSTAIDVFYHIATDPVYTNTALAARAWGRLGDCYFMMNGDAAMQAVTNAALREAAIQRYESAIKYFENAASCPQADVTTRSLAEIRLGQTWAALAPLKHAEREALLQKAYGCFWSVFYEENLRENEQADPSCLKDAGLEAARLAGDMGDWKQAKKIYQKLEKVMPALQGVIEKKIAYADSQENLLTDKK